MTAIAHENVALTDGYQIWEGDQTLESDSPVADLLLSCEDARLATRGTVFYPLACALTEPFVRLATGDPVTHRPTANQITDPRLGWKRSDFDDGIAGFVATQAVARWSDHIREIVPQQQEKLASRAFTAYDEDTGRKTCYSSRRKIAYTASLALPTSTHADHWAAAAGLCLPPKADAPCTCETNPAARALYIESEYGVSQYNDHEWDVLSAAFSEYNALPKWEREDYLRAPGAKNNALRTHFRQQEERVEAETHCRAERHYFGLELEMQLSGSPEIAAPAARTSKDHPENKYGICYPKIEARRYIWDGDNPGPEDVTEIVRFAKITTQANDAALEQAATWEEYEFNSYRAPVVAGTWLDEGDEGRGYLPHESNRLNDTSQTWLKSQIAAEYARRKKYGDVWHSPHRPLIAKRRKDGSTYHVRGHSRFYVLQQNKAEYRAKRQREIAEVLVTLIGREISDPAVVRRIEQLGYDAAIAAMQEKVKGDLDIAEAFPETRLVLV